MQGKSEDVTTVAVAGQEIKREAEGEPLASCRLRRQATGESSLA